MSNLIITEELLKTLKACKDSQVVEYMAQNNLWGKTEDEVLDNMNQNGKLDYVVWWRAVRKTPLFIKTIAPYSVTQYRVFNSVTNEHTNFSTLQEANDALVLVKQEYITNQKGRFSVNQHIDNPDGSVTWVPVDPFTFNEEDAYQVFNPFVGQYTFCSSLSEAKAVQAVQEQEVAKQVSPVQQQITSDNYPYSAWENI